MSDTPRIVFFGTPALAATILEALCESPYKPSLIITAPDKPAGRGYALTPSAVKETAAQYGIAVLQPEKLDEQFAQQLRNEEWDVFIVAAYGKIIPQRILDIPAKGTLNVHGSLLPKYRGSSPIQSALANADATTGPTIMLIDEKMDHGPIIAQKEFPITTADTAATLFEKMAREGAALLVATLPGWLEGTLQAIPQVHEEATYTKMLTKEDGRIDWSKSAATIERLVRAYDPWPGTFTFWGARRVKVLKASICRGAIPGAPGTVVKCDDGIAVCTGDTPLTIHSLQLEGKKPQSAEEFARTYTDFIGATLQ